MAQNIIVSWLVGARFLELETIQTLDELDVSKRSDRIQRPRIFCDPQPDTLDLIEASVGDSPVDFALHTLDPSATNDFYELIVERHRKTSTAITSNRDPSEWLGLMADQLLAQSAIDRYSSAAYELVIEGESYRDRQKPQVKPAN